MNELVHHDWFNCEHPLTVRNKYTHELLTVPCGKCAACKARKILRNVPKIRVESAAHKYTIFFTLTYKDCYLPTINILNYYDNFIGKESSRDFQNFSSLCDKSKDYLVDLDFNLPICKIDDIQRFIKRLRQMVTRSIGLDTSFRYFVSFDYGCTTFRPHYHGILFFNSDELHARISEYIVRSWSVYNREQQTFDPIGRTDVQDAIDCAKYVSTYCQAIPDLPPILTYKEFRIHSVHSCAPSFGSCVRSIESPKDIIEKGLTKITVYDVGTNNWKQQALSRSDIYRLFPFIPSYSRITSDERYEVYRVFTRVLEYPRSERFEFISRLMSVNSFLKDYVTLNQSLSSEQLIRKIDSIYYSVKRLHHVIDYYSIPYHDYDNLLSRFLANRRLNSLVKQFDYEDYYSKSYSQDTVDVIVDPCVSSNKRGLVRYLSSSPEDVDPVSIDPSYFVDAKKRFNKLVKRKLNNAYLEKHPEFKKFHTNIDYHE